MNDNIIGFKSRLGSSHPAQAENDLLELIRGRDASEFSVFVQCFNGRWRVIVTDHTAVETHPPSNKCEGEGADFAEAWQALTPTWAVR